MTDTEKVISLVRKLLAKAHGAGTTPEESAAFAAKANELLLQHKLSMSEVQLKAEDEEEPIGKQFVASWKLNVNKRAKWFEELADTVAYTHFCRLLYHTSSGSVTFVGKTSDRELAVFLFETLAQTAYQQGKKWANKVAREHQKRGERVPYRFLSGWLEGFVAAVNSRLWEQYRKTQKGGGQHALTVFEGQRKRVNDWYDEHTKDMEQADDRSDQWHDPVSYLVGVKAGMNVPLHGGIKPPETARKPTIQAARNQLGKGGD